MLWFWRAERAWVRVVWGGRAVVWWRVVVVERAGWVLEGVRGWMGEGGRAYRTWWCCM